MRRIFALIMVLCLCLSVLTACGSQPETGSVSDGFSFPARDTDGVTEPEPPESTVSEESREPLEKDPDVPSAEDYLVYTLFDADLEDLYGELELLEELVASGAEAVELENQSDYVDQLYEMISDQGTIASVLYYQDMADETLKQQHLDATDMITQAYDAYMQTIRDIYLLGNTEANAVLFAEWTAEELDMLSRYTPEIAELEKRNEELVVAYQALSEDELEEGIVPLYREMILNNNRIAEIYGYDNYYDYAYKMVYDRDYGVDSVETARQYVAEYFPGAAVDALMNFSDGFQSLSYDQMNLVADILEGDKDDLSQDYMQDYFDVLPDQLRKDMMHLLTYDRAVYAFGANARDGAFTTTIDKQPICYFSTGYTGILTYIHEIGHYTASLNMDLGEIPLDLAELHSQGNEWLFISYMKDVLPEDTYAALRDYKLYMDLTTITVSFMVDAFEEIVYTDPNIADYTLEDFTAAADEVMERFGGKDFIESYMTDFQYYWKLVVMEQPVYYISYGVSDLAALNLYTISLENWDEAVDIYEKLARELDTEKGFQDNLAEAGLAGPFHEDLYEAISLLCR